MEFEVCAARDVAGHEKQQRIEIDRDSELRRTLHVHIVSEAS